MTHAETKRVIRKMLKAGFQRNEFSCRIKRSLGCIENVHVCVKNMNKITEKEKGILDSDLGILRVITENGDVHQTIRSYRYTGEVTLIDNREDQK